MESLPNGIYAKVSRLRFYIKQARTDISNAPWGEKRMRVAKAELKAMCTELKELNGKIRQYKKLPG